MKSLVTRKTRTPDPSGEIVVSTRVRKRARQLLELDVVTVIDQTLNSIWIDVSAHRKSNPRLDEAILSAEVLLALLTEMKRSER
jgi:hypothetical protein